MPSVMNDVHAEGGVAVGSRGRVLPHHGAGWGVVGRRWRRLLWGEGR